MRFMTAAVLFVSFSSLACPNLAGNYARCTSATGQAAVSSDVVLAQSVSGGVTTYTLTETDEEGVRGTTSFIADGVARSEADESNPDFPMTTVTTNVCQGQTIVSESMISTAGNDIGSVTVVVRREGARMIQEINGMLLGEQIADTVTCE